MTTFFYVIKYNIDYILTKEFLRRIKMPEPIVNTYNNMTENLSEKVNVKKIKISRLYNIFGFFMSMSAIYGNMTPFGLVFLTLERCLTKRTVISFFMVVLGSLMLNNRVLSAKYIAAEIIYFTVLFVLEKGVKISIVISIATALISLLFSGTMVMYWQGVTLYGTIELLFELFLTASGVIIFDRCRNIVLNKGLDITKINYFDRFSLCVFGGLLILSVKSIYIGNEISVINVICSTLMLCISLGTSITVSAASGIIIGLICGIDTDYFLPLLGAYGFCGFLTGVFSKFGKSGVAVGLILANAVLTVYTNNALEPMLKIYEILISIVVFIFVPDNFIDRIRDLITLRNSDKEGLVRLRDGIKSKLKFVSDSFLSMSKSLNNLYYCEKSEDYIELNLMFDRIIERVCAECKKSELCWESDYENTRKNFRLLLDKIKKDGVLNRESFETGISNNCINYERILDEITFQYDTYRMKKVWKGRLIESRELAGQQLMEFSKILDEIVYDIDVEEPMDCDILRRNLSNIGFKTKSLDISKDKAGKTKIIFTTKRKSLKKIGEVKLIKCLKCLSPNEMKIIVDETEKDKYIKITAIETERYMVEKGFACASYDRQCGDNFGFYKLASGKFVVALSDGMGTGEKASGESRAVIELLDSFFRAGFDKKNAVKLINLFLLMKSDDQMFATVDICIIDLFTGKVEFLKTGAESSYIKQNNGVLSVASSSLPAGIVANNEPEIFTYNLSEGDTVIMATDGIQTKTGGDGWLRKFIEEFNTDCGAASFAESLLKKAEEVNNGIRDDMTVISVKLHKKAV